MVGRRAPPDRIQWEGWGEYREGSAWSAGLNTIWRAERIQGEERVERRRIEFREEGGENTSGMRVERHLVERARIVF